MDIDQLAKHLWDIAWANGYVLMCKLEKARPFPEHCCKAADFEGTVCPGCEWNRKEGCCNPRDDTRAIVTNAIMRGLSDIQ